MTKRYDKNGAEIEVGDYVTYNGRQLDLSHDRLAVIADTGLNSATILFNEEKMPLIIYSSYRSLERVEQVSREVNKSLNAVRDIFYALQEEAIKA